MDNASFEIFSLETMAKDQAKAEEFADYLEERGLLSAPANLKSSILERSRQPDIQIIAGSNRLSKKMLLHYSLKVGLAAACSIGFIIAMPRLNDRYSFFPQTLSRVPVYVGAYEKIQEWNGKINEFSKSFFHMEVPLYDE